MYKVLDVAPDFQGWLLFLLDDRDFSTAFFNSIPLSGSLAGTMLSSHSSPQLLPLDSSTPNSFGASKPCTEPVVAASARPAGDSVNKDRLVGAKACSCRWGKFRFAHGFEDTEFYSVCTLWPLQWKKKEKNAWFELGTSQRGGLVQWVSDAQDHEDFTKSVSRLTKGQAAKGGSYQWNATCCRVSPTWQLYTGGPSHFWGLSLHFNLLSTSQSIHPRHGAPVERHRLPSYSQNYIHSQSLCLHPSLLGNQIRNLNQASTNESQEWMFAQHLL